MVGYAWWRFVSSGGEKNIFYIIRNGESGDSPSSEPHKGL